MSYLPGPWYTNINKKSATVCSVDHGKVYTISTFDNPKLTHEANIANAKLCAAAHDMLKALEQIAFGAAFVPADTHTEIHRLASIARDAVAKARV